MPLSPARGTGGFDTPSGAPTANTNNIKVCARFRPFSNLELKEEGGPKACVRMDGTRLDVLPNSGVSWEDKGSVNSFFFPTLYPQQTKQQQVFLEVGVPVLKDILQGYNGTIFVYGQTGSGKTYTMLGPFGTAERLQNWDGSPLADTVGLMPRIVEGLFQEIERSPESIEFQLAVSYVEVYKEKIRDLLDRQKGDLNLRENTTTSSFYVDGATKRYVTSPGEVLGIIAQGNEVRATAATRVNEHSSRSHSVLSLEVKVTDTEKGEQRTGKLFLVDLAGSERVSKTLAQGEVFEEARQINLSLTTLGLVIKELSESNSHIPYRNSVLTKMLQASLGGNSKTSLIVCCSPSASSAEETLSSLRFGARAANIKNHPRVNAELTFEELKVLLTKAQKEIDSLRAGRPADGSSFQVMEWEAKLERANKRREDEIAAKDAELSDMQLQLLWHQQQIQSRDEILALSRTENAEWEKHWRHAQAQLILANRRNDDLTHQLKTLVSGMSRLQGELTALKVQLEALNEASPASGASGDPAVASEKEKKLLDQIALLQKALADAENENGGMLIELNLAEKKLQIRNERIDNLKVGIRQIEKRNVEMEEARKAELQRTIEENRLLRMEAEQYRSMYERLKDTAKLATQASPPGTRLSKSLKGGSMSPQVDESSQVESIDF